MIDFFIRSNWGRVVREDWRFRVRFRRKTSEGQTQKTTHESKKKEKNFCYELVRKSFKPPTKQQQNSVVLRILLLIKNNGRELCKDGSAFRRKRWRRIVAPSTGGESRNDGTYKKKRESKRIGFLWSSHQLLWNHHPLFVLFSASF